MKPWTTTALLAAGMVVGCMANGPATTAQPPQPVAPPPASATLPPGAMLVLGSLSSRPGSLGHHFFTENDGRLEQKLLVVRLAQTQHDDLFDPAEPLKLEEY